MADLIEFLRARIDEDERDARAVQSADIYDVPASTEDAPGAAFRRLADGPWLADIAVKRKIIAAYADAAEWYGRRENLAAPAGEVHGLRTAIRLLASAYSDHPDFDPDWTVDHG